MRSFHRKCRTTTRTKVVLESLLDSSIGLGVVIFENARGFVDAEERDSGGRSPGRDFTHVVDEALQTSRALVLVIFVVFEDHADVFGQLLEVLDIADDPLGRVVVVPHHGADFVPEEAP